MREDASFAPGWLRVEIAAAVENFTRQPYVPQETLTQMKAAVRALEDSDRLRRGSDVPRSEGEGPKGDLLPRVGRR